MASGHKSKFSSSAVNLISLARGTELEEIGITGAVLVGVGGSCGDLLAEALRFEPNLGVLSLFLQL